jgi:hypothetical protein
MESLAKRSTCVSLALGLWLLAAPALPAQSVAFRRGDANQDGRLDLSDAVSTLRLLFLGGETTTCREAADANDDGALDISDPLFTLSFLFTGGPAPPAPGPACGLDPTPDGLGCTANAGCAPVGDLGQSVFETRSQSPPGGGLPGRETDGTADPGAPPAAGPPAPAATDRLIEESDIYKLVGSRLFVLNRYRGLQILELSDLDHPHLIGRAAIFGYPKEMYVRGDRAYVVVSDYYTFWRDAVAGDAIPHSFYGSQLRIIDISDPTDPRVVGGIDLAGDAGDSRIVGDVMYLVSERYPWYSQVGSDDNQDLTQVLSVDIQDPADIHVVDTKDFPRNGWEDHIQVTPSTIYLASSGYVGGNWNSYQTSIRYVDISDPAGAIVLRGVATVPGRVQDRWSMDEYQGVLRVASGQAWGNGDVYLTTLSVANPDKLEQLGAYTLQVAEQLTSARFDGPRGYLVSYRRIDPLFAFDLSDPMKPVLLSELKMTGWLDFIVPMGDRLAALGHEDLVDAGGQRTISLAVSLLDVSGQPSLLSRVSLDGVWGWVPSTRDDFAKVFKTLPEAGLILFPFQAWSPADYRYIGGVQLIDLGRDTLTRRGLINDAGWVERGIPDGDSTVLTLSTEVFQVVDISDRDQPRLRGRLELSRNVQDFALLPGPYSAQLAGDWYRGDLTLLTTSLADPDSPEPLGQIHLPAPYGRLFVNGSMAYVASVQQPPPGADGQPAAPVTQVQVVDLSDPQKPVLRGSVSLPEEVWLGYRGWFWGSGDEVVQVNGSTLAFHRFRYYWIDCLACPVAARGVNPTGDTTQNIYLVDLKDPDQPVLASTVELKDISWAWGLKASGSTLYLSTYRTEQEDPTTWVTRYFLRRIQVADPAQPVALAEVNIPGMFVDASPGGETIYTQESFWDQDTQTSHSLFYALQLLDDRAYLEGKLELRGSLNSIQVQGGAGFATSSWWEVSVVNGQSQWQGHSVLQTIDLSSPTDLKLAGQAEVPFDYAYLQKVEGGRAFLGSYAGIFSYLVGDITSPTFEEFFRTQGWAQDILLRDDRAYVPSGYYGVQVLALGQGPAQP